MNKNAYYETYFSKKIYLNYIAVFYAQKQAYSVGTRASPYSKQVFFRAEILFYRESDEMRFGD